MTKKLYEIRDNIRAVNEDVRKLKNDNYSEIYNNGDMRYIEEIRRALSICAATVATFIDHLLVNENEEEPEIK